MTDAWGGAWGAAWGDSWGADVDAIPTPNASGGGFGSKARQLAQRDQDEKNRRVALLVCIAAGLELM